MAGDAVSQQQTTGSLRLPTVRSGRTGRRIGRFTLYAIVISASALFMFPFVWTVLSSFKTPWELYTFPPTWFPETPQPQNYAEVFRRVPWGLWSWNSTLVAGLSTIGSVLSAAIVAWSSSLLI